MISNFPIPKFYEITLLNDHQVVVFFESGLEIFEFDLVGDDKWVAWRDGFKKVAFEFSCCGIDLNFDSSMMAIGDLSGQIHFYSIASDWTITKICRYKFQFGVWSVAFHPTEPNQCMVGLFSGYIFYIDPIKDVVLDIGTVNKTCTWLHWFTEGSKNYLAASSTNGKVKIFEHIKENEFEEMTYFLAHWAQEDFKEDAPSL